MRLKKGEWYRDLNSTHKCAKNAYAFVALLAPNIATMVAAGLLPKNKRFKWLLSSTCTNIGGQILSNLPRNSHCKSLASPRWNLYLLCFAIFHFFPFCVATSPWFIICFECLCRFHWTIGLRMHVWKWLRAWWMLCKQRQKNNKCWPNHLWWSNNAK